MTTIHQALIDAAQRVDAHEARLLLFRFTGFTREFAITHPESELSDEALQAYRHAIDQLEAGVPLPYITGVKPFWKNYFKVTPDVLIPREDTETVIDRVLEIAQERKVGTILDLGTGSGCIAVTLALELPQAKVHGVDISPAAVEVARENAKAFGAGNVDFSVGSWFESVGDRTFDCIVSNPPYIHPEDKHLENLTHEPINALTDGVDGMSCIRAIVHDAEAHLTPGGWIVFEHGYDQGEAVRSLLECSGYEDVQTLRDFGMNERVTSGRKPL
ncbi:MAG: peptide chain release factor N(5)-glutamine methyltransferase [Duodenibacillus sp.]|nr:peptide chain release factor N(5)-glutamine methyltransferase [Duodenibacillus sp.]